MKTNRTLKIFTFIITTFIALQWLAIIFSEHLTLPLDVALFTLMIIFDLPIFALNKLGIHGLLSNNGHCGLTWCDTTLLGDTIKITLWLTYALALAWSISNIIGVAQHLTTRSTKRK